MDDPAAAPPVRSAGHLLLLDGRTAVVDGTVLRLPPRQAGVLLALVQAQGRVLSRADLIRLVWVRESADEHAVEMTVARLRRALGPAGHVVQTVVKRGYRLAPPT